MNLTELRKNRVIFRVSRPVSERGPADGLIPGVTEGTTEEERPSFLQHEECGQDFSDCPILFPAADFVMGSTGLWSFGLAEEMGTCTSLSLVCDALAEPWAAGGRPREP